MQIEHIPQFYINPGRYEGLMEHLRHERDMCKKIRLNTLYSWIGRLRYDNIKTGKCYDYVNDILFDELIRFIDECDCTEEMKQSAKNRIRNHRVEMPVILVRLPYKEYLKTRHWKEKRMEAMGHHGHKCMLCQGDKGISVHHRTYVNKGKEKMKDLMVVCRDCHHKVHHEGEMIVEYCYPEKIVEEEKSVVKVIRRKKTP